MKQTKIILLAIFVMAIALLLPLMIEAGSLEPSSAPAPTMRTLNDIYTTNSWSIKLPCDSPGDCPRFEVLADFNNEAVLDRETGLVWEQSPSTQQYEWDVAQAHCYLVEIGGRKGWRLPTVEQLASLTDATQSGPALPSGHPFSNVQSAFYWSATTGAGSTDGAWGATFSHGSVFVESKALYIDKYAWCVRGGQSHDAY